MMRLKMPYRLLCTIVCLLVAHGVPGAQAPDETDALNDCFRSMHDDLGGSESCDEALTRPLDDTQRGRVMASLAMMKVRQASMPAARELMNQALALAPQDHVVVTNHGSLLLHEGEFPAALAAYETVIAQSLEGPLNAALEPALYLNRSLALRALGRYEEAARDYAMYLQLAAPAPQEPAPLETTIPGIPEVPEY